MDYMKNLMNLDYGARCGACAWTCPAIPPSSNFRLGKNMINKLIRKQ